MQVTHDCAKELQALLDQKFIRTTKKYFTKGLFRKIHYFFSGKTKKGPQLFSDLIKKHWAAESALKQAL